MSAAGMHASQWARVVLDELDLDLSRDARHLVETLAHMGNEIGTAWPSLARLQRRMGLGRTAVTDARRELVAIGLLHAAAPNKGGRRRSDGRGIAATYRLALPVTPTGFVRPQPSAPADGSRRKVIQNRPPQTKEPSAPADAKSHRSPTVNTSTDACNARAANGEPKILVTIERIEPGDATSWEGFA